MEIPKEILLIIMSFVDVETMKNFRLTTKENATIALSCLISKTWQNINILQTRPETANAITRVYGVNDWKDLIAASNKCKNLERIYSINFSYTRSLEMRNETPVRRIYITGAEWIFDPWGIFDRANMIYGRVHYDGKKLFYTFDNRMIRIAN